MSKSPKYTSASLEADRAWELAQRRRQRELERQQREREAAIQRREAERSRIAGELAGMRTRARAVAEEADAAGLSPRHAALLAEIKSLAVQVRSASGDGELGAVRGRLVSLHREADDIVAAVGEILAARDRDRALTTLRASLASAPDRADLDAPGAAETGRLLAEAERRLADGLGFAETYDQLSVAARGHLARVQERRAELARMRQDADADRSAVRAILDEARAVGASLNGAADAEQLLASLAAAAAAGDVRQARDLCAKAQQARGELERDFDRWLDQLDRAQLVFDAVAKALPKAGLQILPATYRAQGTGASVQAERADGSSIQLTVIPDRQTASRSSTAVMARTSWSSRPLTVRSPRATVPSSCWSDSTPRSRRRMSRPESCSGGASRPPDPTRSRRGGSASAPPGRGRPSDRRAARRRARWRPAQVAVGAPPGRRDHSRAPRHRAWQRARRGAVGPPFRLGPAGTPGGP